LGGKGNGEHSWARLGELTISTETEEDWDDETIDQGKISEPTPCGRLARLLKQKIYLTWGGEKRGKKCINSEGTKKWEKRGLTANPKSGGSTSWGLDSTTTKR